MIRVNGNRNSRYLLISIAVFIFITIFYFTSSNSPSYHSQLLDSQFKQNVKDKFAGASNDGSSNEAKNNNVLGDSYVAATTSTTKSAATATATPAVAVEAEEDVTPKNEPPKPPYPQSGNSKSDSTKNKPKVKADKAFSTGEQLKDGYAKSYDKAAPIVKEGGNGETVKISADSTGNLGKPDYEPLSSCDSKSEYVVMIDAGSSGSRVHVYEFDVCYSPPKLLKEEFKMLKPGLSSFDTDTVGAAKSLDPLLKLAVETVPKLLQGCTPVAVKATAGLRMLGKDKSDNILNHIRKYLETEWPFAVVEGDGVSIMDGADEGVYAWITANYLMGNIGSKDKSPTAAVFDLGGGSTQIVFEPHFPINQKLAEGNHKYSLDFGSREFELYQYSHLGYGLMEGRNKINKLIVETFLKSKPDELAPAKAGATSATVDMVSPCMAPGNTAKNVKVKFSDDEFYLVNFVGPETPAGAQCRFLAEKVLNKELECTLAPCSFNGVHQPSLVTNFQLTSDLYIFSFFYDRTNPLGMPSSFTLSELSDLAKIVCNGDSFWALMLGSIDGSLEELGNEPLYCLDLSFMVAMLHTGYDIPLHRELKTAKKIAGNELGWCLGASLPLLEKKGWKCRVKEA